MTAQTAVILALTAPLIFAFFAGLYRHVRRTTVAPSRATGPLPTSGAAGQFACSFCGKAQGDVAKLIAGPKVFICNECVALSKDVLRDSPKRIPSKLPTPAGIEAAIADVADMSALDWRRLALAVYHHARRAESVGFSPIPKQAILLIGPGGTGKARLAEAIARTLKVAVKAGDLSQPATGFRLLSDTPPFASGAVVYVSGVEDIAHFSEQIDLVDLIEGRGLFYSRAPEYLFIFGCALPGNAAAPDYECSDANAWNALLAHGLDIELVRWFSPVVWVGEARQAET